MRQRANFVLWRDGLDYYVSERVGPKRDSELREHFVSFHASEASAWLAAERHQEGLIMVLEDYIQTYRRKRRQAKGTP